MKRTVPIFAAALCAVTLAACQPPSDGTPGQFEPFDLNRVGQTYCAFDRDDTAETQATDREQADVATDDGVLFATRMEDPDHMAHAQFKGEFLRLIPRDPPVFGDAPLRVSYTVFDYPEWTVQLDLAPIGGGDEHADYAGTMTLVGTDAAVRIAGSCGV